MSFWKNKLVWITGASSGIGEAIAHELAPKGASLILSSRRVETLELLRANLANSDNHQILALDLSDPTSLYKVLEQNQALLDKVDVLFNNGGISQRSLTWEATPESERLMMETNYFGAIRVARAVLPGMMSRNSGSIVVMSSPAGKFGFPLRSSYSASKHALHGYFDSLRAELKGKAIKITMICPGRVQTNISLNALTSDGSPQNQMDVRLSKGMSPKECANVIIAATEHGKAEIYLGKEQILIYLNRYFPRLFRWIVQRINPK